MSRQELADACNEALAANGAARRRAGLDASTIGAYEQGSITWPNADYRAALRAVFSSTDSALGFYAVRRPRTTADESFDRPLAEDTVSSAGDAVDHRVDLSDLSAAETEELISYLRDQWHLLVRADNLLGPRHALSGVQTQLGVLNALLGVSRSAARATVAGLAAQYAESAAWLYEDAANMASAQRWTTAAMEWSIEANDPAMLAWVMYRRSQQSTTTANGGQVIGLAEAARRDESRLPSTMRAAIRVQLAHGHAVDQDARQAGRLLDEAHRWAATDIDGDARAGHGSFCTASYIETHRASCLNRLGRPQEAVTIYEQALPLIPAVYRRDRAAALSGLAYSYAALDDAERAAAIASEALPIAQRAGSDRIATQIRTVARALRRHERVPAVASLLHDLGAVR